MKSLKTNKPQLTLDDETKKKAEFLMSFYNRTLSEQVTHMIQADYNRIGKDKREQFLEEMK
jgi:hypothetical protein